MWFLLVAMPNSYDAEKFKKALFVYIVTVELPEEGVLVCCEIKEDYDWTFFRNGKFIDMNGIPRFVYMGLRHKQKRRFLSGIRSRVNE